MSSMSRLGLPNINIHEASYNILSHLDQIKISPKICPLMITRDHITDYTRSDDTVMVSHDTVIVPHDTQNLQLKLPLFKYNQDL